jgi:ubiquinone biosynthesis protein
MMPVRVYMHTLWRFLVISVTLLRQVFRYLPHRARFIPETKDKKEIRKYLKTKQPRITSPAIMKATLQRLGPTFIKFGQFLSVRPDLVPPEFCDEFRKLQDEVPPFSFEFAQVEVERELGRPLTEVFSEFDRTPIAAASVSQVHRARLISGEEVAVKVQRPGVRESMETDILIMLFFASLAERLIPSFRKNRPKMLVREFSRWTDRELDFLKEGKNAIHFFYHAQDYPGVKFPRVFLQYTTERVLTMEFIRGVNVLEIPEGTQREATARLVAETILKQIFVDGFFHGDPHPGNIFLLPDGTIAYLDFGIVGYLTKELREGAFDVLYGMAEGSVDRVIDSFLELCDASAEEVDIPSYRREINEILTELHICSIAAIPFTCMLEQFLNTSLAFGVNVPSDFVIMSKAIATLEGTCISLNPDIRITKYLKPFVERYMVVVPGFDEMMRMVKAGPFEAGRIRRLTLKHLKKAAGFIENPTFRIESGEFRNIVREMDKASVNISYGVIIAALVVFAATLSNESVFEHWLKSALHLPPVPLLPIASLAVALYLWIRLYLRNRPQKTRKR